MPKLPFQDVIVLLLYLMPGFLALEIYRSHFPAKKRSEVASLIWSVIHTFAIHLALAGLAAWFNYSQLNFLRENSPELGASSVVILLLAGVSWGLLLTLLHWARLKLPFFPGPDPISIWPLMAARADDQELWVLVRVKGGPIYLGWIRHYSFDPDRTEQDLYLTPAYLVDEKLEVQRDLGDGGVYLRTSDLLTVEFIPGR